MTMPRVSERHELHPPDRPARAASRRAGHRRWRRRAAAILLTTTVHAVLPGAGIASADHRDGPSVGSPTGLDVSYPQCNSRLPTGQSFAIVGVNGGTATTTNPCLDEQLEWAAASTGDTVHDQIQLYVNTGNPGSGSAYWPQSGSTPYGDCDATASEACAYQYGWERAVDDATTRGISAPEQYMWWLDVEIANTWDYGEGGHARNAAVLEGMTDYFTSIGVRGVGIYSTAYQWGHIVGDEVSDTSSLNGLSNWRPAGSDLAAAKRTCGVAPLTPGGVVEMTQYTKDFDYNHTCI